MDSKNIFGILSDSNIKTKPRPYVNHSIEFKKSFSVKERMAVLEKAGYNVFFFPAEMISGCDFLSDSGTTTMTNEQWAAMNLGDESYGANKGYFLLMDAVNATFGEGFFNEQSIGKPNAFIFHQGRPCEDALFSAIGKLGKGLIIPSNGHFDTTHANIDSNGIKAVNLFSKELSDEISESHFKGNMDLIRLKNLLEESHDKIPVVFMTITNNTGGGQPVSMENIKAVSLLCHNLNIPFFFDACRFAENAWFIKNYEEGYFDKAVKDIVHEMFSYVDGFTISFKKDGLVNMGGGLFLKNEGVFVKKYPSIPDALMNIQILKEGNPSYGGMSGRDIMALVTGLKTIINEEYLSYRINQVKEFGESLHEKGIPVLMPVGGHAVYIDMTKFFSGTSMKPEDFGGVAFTALLLGVFGHRACELGNFAFGEYDPKTGEEKLPEVNFVRFAVPRLRYEKQDLEAAAEAVKILYDNRDKIPAIDIVFGRELPLRHFKAKFRFRE
jgi:tryptophanase